MNNELNTELVEYQKGLLWEFESILELSSPESFKRSIEIMFDSFLDTLNDENIPMNIQDIIGDKKLMVELFEWVVENKKE